MSVSVTFLDGRVTGRIHLGASLHDIADDDRFHLVGAKSIAGDCGAIATAPRFGAGTSLRLPPNVPIAVRTGSAKTTECCDVMTKPLEPWAA
jgi:hypothetical protein